MPDAPPLLAGWANFYVLLGTSAAALIGLTFIVVTIVASDDAETTVEGVAAFSSPTVGHFGVVLFVAAVIAAPWRAPADAAIPIALGGIYGILFACRTVVLARRIRAYTLQMDDWLWYAAVPLAAYAVVLAAGLLLLRVPAPALFLLGAGMLLLIFTGIHNAWDVVTYLATQRKADASK